MEWRIFFVTKELFLIAHFILLILSLVGQHVKRKVTCFTEMRSNLMSDQKAMALLFKLLLPLSSNQTGLRQTASQSRFDALLLLKK